jgi:hypothetical protein
MGNNKCIYNVRWKYQGSNLGYLSVERRIILKQILDVRI